MFSPDKCVCALRSHLTESMLTSQVSPLLTCFLRIYSLSLGDSRRSSCSRAEIRRWVLQEVPQPKHNFVSHQLRQGNTFFTSFVWLSYLFAVWHFFVWRSTCALQASQVLIDGSSSRRAMCRRWTFCSRTTEQNSCSTGSPSSATFQKPQVRTSTPSYCPKPGESGSVAPFLSLKPPYSVIRLINLRGSDCSSAAADQVGWSHLFRPRQLPVLLQHSEEMSC